MHTQYSKAFLCHDDHGTSHLHPPLLFKHSTPEHTVSQRVDSVIIRCREGVGMLMLGLNSKHLDVHNCED